MRPLGSSSRSRFRVLRSTLLAGFAAALLVPAVSLAPIGAPPARAAAGDGLDVVTIATYTLRPPEGMVSVAIDVTARNVTPDEQVGGLVRRTWFTAASFAVHAEATRVRATSGGARLATELVERQGYAELDVTFAGRIHFGESARFRIEYDLPGGEPRSESDVRVGSAFATFVAWAFGDSGDVRITIPPGFDVEDAGSPVERSTMDGATVLSAGGVTEALDWYVLVTADRPAALTETRLQIPSGEAVTVRGWPEDTEWNRTVGDLLTRGLPVLDELVGLDWPVSGELEVFEVHTPLLEGYGGFYDPAASKIQISEDLDEPTILHEASHAWFNDGLFVGRWIDEGLADEYGLRALAALGRPADSPGVASPSEEDAFPLNDWPPPQPIRDDETEAREDYGYRASWTVVDGVLREVGVERMRDLLRAASGREIAYVGDEPPEPMPGDVDWRRFLDLVEERAGVVVDPLWERYVVTGDELALLRERRAVRLDYQALEDAGEGWSPPFAVREPMARWDWVAARSKITDATGVLDLRDQIADRAAAAGLTPPDALEVAYETAHDEVAAVKALARDELEALAELEEASAALGAPRDALTTIGLLWEVPPEEALEEATTAFEAGDMAAVSERVGAAEGRLVAAGEIGRGRVVAAGAGTSAVLLLGGGIVLIVRRRRHRPAVPAAPGPSASAESYATLPGTPPDGPPGVEGPAGPVDGERGAGTP